MNKILTIFVPLFLLLQIFQTQADTNVVVKNQIIKDEIASKKLDGKAKILADYLARHNSPLQYHAQDFIDAAKEYGLDWRLMAAISGVESTFGKFIPGGYNGWGWGVYGNQAIYFKSWREGIFMVSKGLRENYINKGYKEPYSMNRIYAASPFWGGKVTYFMNDLQNYADISNREDIEIAAISPLKIAAISGRLVW